MFFFFAFKQKYWLCKKMLLESLNTVLCKGSPSKLKHVWETLLLCEFLVECTTTVQCKSSDRVHWYVTLIWFSSKTGGFPYPSPPQSFGNFKKIFESLDSWVLNKQTLTCCRSCTALQGFFFSPNRPLGRYNLWCQYVCVCVCLCLCVPQFPGEQENSC